MSVPAALMDALRARGIVPADAPLPGASEEKRPWFVALLQGMAGWLAGIFLLVFVGLIVKPDTVPGILGCGAFLLAAAWGLYYADRNAVFLDQLALALSIAGQIAVAWAVLKDARSPTLVASVLLLLQLGVFAIMTNRVARVISAFFACIAWIYTVRFTFMPRSSSRWSFLDDDGMFHAPMFGSWTVPASWLITWAPMILGIAWLLRQEPKWMANGARGFARPALTGLLLCAAFGGVVSEPLNFLALGVEEMGIPFNVWALFPLLSIALSMYAAYAAFSVRSYGLIGVAVFGALVHLSRFYYLYGTTLLWKSMLMLIIGAALLLAARLLAPRPERT